MKISRVKNCNLLKCTKTKEDFSEEKRDQKGRVIFLKDKEGAETKISYPKDGIMETFTLKNSKFSPEDKILKKVPKNLI